MTGEQSPPPGPAAGTDPHAGSGAAGQSSDPAGQAVPADDRAAAVTGEQSAGRRAATAAGFVILALVLAVTCTLLGRWQWNRHVAKSAAIETVEANYDAPPVPLAELTTPGGAMDPGVEWSPVEVTGVYRTEATVLLRNRPVNGQAAFRVLTPLVLSDPAGAVLVVDRGWLPAQDAAGPGDVPEPAEQSVQLTARLRAAEAPSGRTAPSGQVQAVSVAEVLAAGPDGGAWAAGADAVDGYAVLVTPDSGLGGYPRPSSNPGSHLSYAFQWWTFALGSLVGFGYLAWREATDGAAPGGASTGKPAQDSDQRARPTRRRRMTAEDEEDALIDRQAGAGG